MTTDFENFTKALEKHQRSGDSDLAPPRIENVTVLGGGPDGQLLAALSLAQNLSVTLFSAYGAELNSLRSAAGINLRGDGPIGTFQIDQNTSPAIQTTAELDSAVRDADLIFLTGPVHKHRTYAMVLADHLRDGQILVISPARTFSALDTRWLLRMGGCRADITIVEVVNLPYWIRSEKSTLHLTESLPTQAACIPTDRINLIHELKTILPNISAAPSVVFSSFSDGSGIVESAALALGLSHIGKSKQQLLPGAEPLAARQNFHSHLLGAESLEVIYQMFDERRSVARHFGVRNLPDSENWVQAHAGGVEDKTRSIPSQTDARALLRCAVVGSLIPLRSAGEIVGVPTPLTNSLITVAGSLLGWDLSAAGRTLEKMGISATSAVEARQRMEAIARGG